MQKEYFTAALLNVPYASYDLKGLYVGAELEYVGFVYSRIGIETFSALNDGYTAALGGIGISGFYGYADQIRLYGGARLGIIKRFAANAAAGIESGIDYSISDHCFLGERLSYDYRSDAKFYDYPDSMKYTMYFRVGFKF